MTRTIRTIAFWGIFVCFYQLKAQTPACGVPPLEENQRKYLLEHIKQIPVDLKNTGTTCVPLQVYIFRQNNGSGGLTNEQLNRGLAFLNSFYYDAGIEFFYCNAPVFINNSDLYDFDETAPDNDSEADLVNAAGQSANAANIYVVDRIYLDPGFAAAGYAYYPSNNPVTNKVVMDKDFFSLYPNGTLTHEFGHYFSLPHTFEGTINGNTDPDAEHVPRSGPPSNCTTAGDTFCDTEADPTGPTTNCTYSGGGSDIFGNPYTPLVDNIMSYYPDVCGGLFTNEQLTAIAQGLVTRQGHTTYSLDCSPQPVNVPTGLSAALNADENGIEITWTDVASNETGYLIERSTTSAATGFRQLTYGSTPANGTFYEDNDIAANTTYWYRIKPSNGDCDTYSAVISYAVGLLYCPAGSFNCDEYIDRVTLESIDNDTDCSPGGYARYTDQIATLAREQTYTLTLKNGVAYTGDVYGVWADWNQDGDFNDPGETVSTGSIAFTTPLPINFTVPVSAMLGATRLRIRITYDTTPTPCGKDVYGEVEDYGLLITSAPLPVEWVSFSGRPSGNAVDLHWQTANEQESDYFRIERSRDGKVFEALGAVAAQGNTTTFTDYRWTDPMPFPGVNYYRLRQVDFSGEYSYSDVIAVEAAFWTEMLFFPNPVRENGFLQFESPRDEKGWVKIYGSDGQLHSTQVIQCTAGWNRLELETARLLPGVYALHLQAGAVYGTYTLIKW